MTKLDTKRRTASWPGLVVGLVVVFLLRLLPWRPPNVEPVTATLLPFGRTWGALVGALFGVLSIVLFDAVTAGVGEWTLVVATAYALMGIVSSFFLRAERVSPLRYMLIAVCATLVFDAVTGVLYSWLRYEVPLMTAFVGQIPFTLNHVAGNAVLGFVLSPLIERWVTANPRLQWSYRGALSV